MKINLNQVHVDQLDELDEVSYDRPNGKKKVKRFKTDEIRGRGRKPKKFRDYNKKK
jgi:hypothetical protein|tara:strand:- start:654 stop:821 length:168 start_codon:yes stop_codon:yes gene_type:complete